MLSSATNSCEPGSALMIIYIRCWTGFLAVSASSAVLFPITQSPCWKLMTTVQVAAALQQSSPRQYLIVCLYRFSQLTLHHSESP